MTLMNAYATFTLNKSEIASKEHKCIGLALHAKFFFRSI